MAHKNKAQLIRLIKTLNCANFDFFVHLDSEWKLSDDDVDDIKRCSERVYVINNRIHGELDQWSLPQITLNLIDEAVKVGKGGGGYNYYLLLSGQDYPIKSVEYINLFLEKNYPKPFIDVESYQTGNWVSTKFLLVRWMHKIEEIHKKYRSGIRRKIRVAPYVLAEYLERFFWGTPYERVEKYGFKLYGGSQWWILPDEVIQYINDIRLKKPKFIKEYMRTWTPDETFFQTMAMNSPLANEILIDNELFEVGDQRCMTYANFVAPGKTFRGHPHIIEEIDFDRIISKKQLFARKFDCEVDSKILDKIDDYFAM